MQYGVHDRALTQRDWWELRHMIRQAAVALPERSSTFISGQVPRSAPTGSRTINRTPPPRPKGRRKEQ